ncbi:MAG: hypothetical protein Q4Q03_00035 [Bowdeniella nasicola]|nr:hypothetical protein [Bowdeniella nasicola]
MITATLAVTSLLAALVVFLPIEVVLLAGGGLAEVPAWALAAICAATHTLGKGGHYALAAGLITNRRLHAWLTARVSAATRARARRWNNSPLVTYLRGPTGWVISFSAAAISLPPYALMPLVAPSVGQRWWEFATASFAGRWLRFYLILAVPMVARYVTG